MKMPDTSSVAITIQMKNDYENAETVLTVTMLDAYAVALLDEIRSPGKNLVGNIVMNQVREMAVANAQLLGYELTMIASASILD